MSFSSWKKILKASFFGLIFGMIAGIFLAPEKGDRAFIHYKQVFKMAGPEDVEIYNDNFSQVLSLAGSLKK